MNLSPLMVGRWDGANLWLQWESAAEARYLVRVRIRANDSATWGAWVIIVKPFTRPWAVVQLVRARWQAQAQVAVLSEDVSRDMDWQPAAEVTFARSAAPFHFENATAAPIDLPVGATFDAMVDLAACSYRLREPLTVPAQGDATAEMESLQTTAWMQVDAAGDFCSRQLRGLTVTNAGPSTGGLSAPTGLDFTLLEPEPPGGPHCIVKSGRRWGLPVNLAP